MKTKAILTMAVLILFIWTACLGSTEEVPTKVSISPQIDDSTPEAFSTTPFEEATPVISSNTPRVVEIGEMTVDRAAHQATLLESGQVLITGGCAGNGCDHYLDSVELFDPETKAFHPAPPMSTPRAGHVAVTLPDGRVLVCGGWTGHGAATSAEIYDPAMGHWTLAGEMNDARESLMAVPLADGRVLVTGGSGGSDNLASAEVFDPVTSTFSAAGPMSTNHYLAVGLEDGRVLLTGGVNESGVTLNTSEIFDPTTGKFQQAGNMETPRVKHAGVLLPDGQVFVIGGSVTRNGNNLFKSTEFYDPATGTFSAGPDMNFGRHKIRDAVVVLPSGEILVAGGATHLEIFDPVERSFTLVEGELSGPQMFATATRLLTGDALVLGGYDDHTRPTATAWLVHTDR